MEKQTNKKIKYNFQEELDSILTNINITSKDLFLLFESVEESNLEKLKELLLQYPKAIYVKSIIEHKSLLHLSKTFEITKYLIEQGCDVNELCEMLYTPLHYAVIDNNILIAHLLLENKANINLQNISGDTPLHIAKTTEMVELLINYGADVNACDVNNSTPLHICKSVEIAKVLIDKGANVNATNKYGNSPLHLIDNIEIIKLLIKNDANIHNINNYGKTPLHVSRKVDVIELLINNGANVNAASFKRNTPLHHVKNIKIAEMLIKYGADLTIKNYYNQTPFDTMKDNIKNYILDQAIFNNIIKNIDYDNNSNIKDSREMSEIKKFITI
jgi:ankyrin repeat protein